MKILAHQITEPPKDASFAQGIEELNVLSSSKLVKDFRFPRAVDVSLVYYRSGMELFFQGRIGGTIEGCCSRCLKSYSFPLEKEFEFVLTPEPTSPKSKELSRDELGLSFYGEKEIDLAPFIREQVLLALPMRPLCAEDCRGLCPGCGMDLNDDPCRCASPQADPRMAVFRAMKLDQ